MMKLNYSLLLFPLLLIFYSACEEEDAEDLVDSAIRNTTGNSIKATIDGQLFEPALITGTVDSNFVVIGGIDGISSNYPNMVISIPKDADPQTYSYPVNPLDTSNNFVGVLYNLNDSITYTLNSGSFQLSKHDKSNQTVEGSFQGYLYELSSSPDSIQITSASLKASYN